jgi:hypothetical protein
VLVRKARLRRSFFTVKKKAGNPAYVGMEMDELFSACFYRQQRTNSPLPFIIFLLQSSDVRTADGLVGKVAGN